MRETASGRRQAPRHVASILDAARELGIRDAQVLPPKPWPPGLDQFFVLLEFVHIDGATGR